MKKMLPRVALALSLSSILLFTAMAGANEDYEVKPTATAPARPPVRAARAPHWSYQPVQRPEIPAVHDRKWVRTPIDAFVLAKLESWKLHPSADADRATFIRRATLDTWGLIPTPEEVQAFVNDRSPKAYEKLIDRLLASPKYGERWGRRWLDLARHADSDGYNADGTRPNLWRYRDYVIEAFNKDKPYDQFVKEQLAGDELWPDNQEALIATGFLRNYPDEINARDLNLKKQEIATDLTDTVGAVLLASTVSCARCHDHKFDRMSQREYFQLQAYFINASARDDVPVGPQAALAKYQLELARYNEQTQQIRAQLEAILQPVIDKLEADRLQGFVPQTRASIEKPESERNAYDRWIYHRNLWTMQGRTRNAERRLEEKDKESFAQYQKLKAELAAYDHLKPRDPGQLSTIFELGAESPPTHILASGIYDRLLDEVQPGTPAAFSSSQPVIVPTATSSGRRSALASWIVDPANPLTARVYVNRVWAQYFGRGIADTVSDFGKQGEKPVNAELLDYLAATFVHDYRWSIKKLQRSILLSSVYRQSSAERADALSVDPDNRLLASFPRLRLDAEQIRDSLLAASGLLDEKLGGPAVFPPIPPGFLFGPARNAWQVSENPRDHYRRSVYVFTRRNTAYPLFEAFDMANPNTVHTKREVTTTAPQALALINSEQVYEWSRALAGRAAREAGADNDAARIERLYQILYARKPDAWEKEKLLGFLDAQEKITQQQLANGKKLGTPDGYGIQPASFVQADRLYESLYGRPADRLERAGLFEFVAQQQQKAAAFAGNDAPASEGSTPGERNGFTAARAAAFVDLAHTLANSNEFTYRF
jgi:Protein of unknown function (DUF1553)/Protein of unknown function (DUF1549)